MTRAAELLTVFGWSATRWGLLPLALIGGAVLTAGGLR